MKILIDAKFPEDIFGPVKTHAELKAEYIKLCKMVHPDKNKEADAELAFKNLALLYAKGKAAIINGTYGKKVTGEFINIGKDKVENIAFFKNGKIAELKTGEFQGKKIIIKVAKNTRDNDLLNQEVEAYRKIDAFVKDKPEQKVRDNHIGKLITSVVIGGRRANLLEFIPNAVTLESIAGRVDNRSMVWIWKRMLAALSICHKAGVIHNAVLPDNFLIDTDAHNGILIDFCYSTASLPKIVDTSLKDFYPPEVFTKRALKPETDVFLMGATIRTLCSEIPKRVDMLLKACMLKHGRLDSVDQIYQDVDACAFALYGAPKFHKFQLK